jgi:hypothetical protein
MGIQILTDTSKIMLLLVTAWALHPVSFPVVSLRSLLPQRTGPALNHDVTHILTTTHHLSSSTPASQWPGFLA